MKKISFFYTIFSESGEILDSNQDNKPLSIMLGEGAFIPYVEEQLFTAYSGTNTHNMCVT